MELLLLGAGLLSDVQLHGLVGLDAGQHCSGRFPCHTQRAEVIKLPALLVKRRHVQLRVPVIRHRNLRDENQKTVKSIKKKPDRQDRKTAQRWTGSERTVRTMTKKQKQKKNPQWQRKKVEKEGGVYHLFVVLQQGAGQVELGVGVDRHKRQA